MIETLQPTLCGLWSLLPSIDMLIAMRVCIQRVSEAKVVVADEVVGQIGAGLLVLVGVCAEDTEEELNWLVQKVVNLRIFEDDQGKMNLSALDVGVAMLVVSQFTLYGDCRKGRRPSFVSAAPPEQAEPMIERFVELARGQGIPVETGRFRADMQVTLTNDGPVTIWIDTAEK